MLPALALRAQKEGLIDLRLVLLPQFGSKLRVRHRPHEVDHVPDLVDLLRAVLVGPQRLVVAGHADALYPAEDAVIQVDRTLPAAVDAVVEVPRTDDRAPLVVRVRRLATEVLV